MDKSSFKQFVFLSGLPRSGSTLLSAILDQNPNIHAEGNSAVCQLMWDVSVSCNSKSKEQLEANYRKNLDYDLVSTIPHIYYKNISKPIVVDKCRSWTLKPNIEMIRKYINPDYRIIILYRPIIDIIKSFGKLYLNNNVYSEEKLLKLLEPNSEPLMRSLNGLLQVKYDNNIDNFLFINYNDLINYPQETLQKIYKFCGWEYFEHDFNNIVNNHPENDDVYGLIGMHVIKNSICINLSSDNHFKLSKNIIKQCNKIDEQINKLLSK